MVLKSTDFFLQVPQEAVCIHCLQRMNSIVFSDPLTAIVTCRATVSTCAQELLVWITRKHSEVPHAPRG